MHDSKLMFDIRDETGEQRAVHILSLTPFRRTLRDYFMICESYYAAIRTQTTTQIEAIDMGRRGLHNEGADLLLERLAGKIVSDLGYGTPPVYPDHSPALEGLIRCAAAAVIPRPVR